MKAPYPYRLMMPQQVPQQSGFNIQKAIGYTAIVGIGGFALYHFGKSLVQESKAKTSDKKSFTTGNAATNAKLIKMCFENDGYGWIRADLPKLRRILISMKSQREFDAADAEYDNQYHRKMFADMKDKLQTSEYQEMLAIKYGKPLEPGQKAPYLAKWLGWARRLKAAFDKMYMFISGVDTDALFTVFNEIPTQKEFVNVADTFKKEFNLQMIELLKSKLGGDYKKYMSIITAKPKQ